MEERAADHGYISKKDVTRPESQVKAGRAGRIDSRILSTIAFFFFKRESCLTWNDQHLSRNKRQRRLDRNSDF